MSSISWNPSYPATASTASEGDNAIRSLMTNFATGVGEMVYFPGSAASQGASTSSTGDVRLGTARAARVSNVSGNVGDGYLGFETSKGGLWHLGSSWTYAPLGHPATLVGVGGLTPPFVSRWVRLSGTYSVLDTSAPLAGTGRIAFTSGLGSSTFTFGAPPVVLVTARIGSAGDPSFPQDAVYGAAVSDTTGFTSIYSVFSASATSIYATVAWESYGTVAYTVDA